LERHALSDHPSRRRLVRRVENQTLGLGRILANRGPFRLVATASWQTLFSPPRSMYCVCCMARDLIARGRPCRGPNAEGICRQLVPLQEGSRTDREQHLLPLPSAIPTPVEHPARQREERQSRQSRQSSRKRPDHGADSAAGARPACRSPSGLRCSRYGLNVKIGSVRTCWTGGQPPARASPLSVTAAEAAQPHPRRGKCEQHQSPAMPVLSHSAACR